MASIFEDIIPESYPYQFDGALHLDMVLGGIPSDPRVAEGWLRTKIKDTDQRIQDMVAKTMAERQVDAEAALKIVNELKNLNGFKKGLPEDGEHDGELYLEGRQLKAAIKEAVSVAVGANKLKLTGWGQTKKYLTNYVPEHIFVINKKLWLGVTEPSGVLQQFVHTHRGSSIQYQEYVLDTDIQFHVVSDHPFTDHQWALIWTTGEKQGLGASRSQSYGTYEVTRWDRRPIKMPAWAQVKAADAKKALKEAEELEAVEQQAEQEVETVSSGAIRFAVAALA